MFNSFIIYSSHSHFNNSTLCILLKVIFKKNTRMTTVIAKWKLTMQHK